MKKTNRYLPFFISLLVVLGMNMKTSAQTSRGPATVQLTMANCVERSVKEAELMKAGLGLNHQQTEKVAAINLNFFKKILALPQGKEKSNETKKLMHEKEKELKKVLTDAQFKKYQDDIEALKVNAEKRKQARKTKGAS